MAFEKIFLYTDTLARLYNTAAEKNSPDQYAYLAALVAYGETALQTAKFVSQREHWRKTLFEINPSFAEGYFKRKA